MKTREEQRAEAIVLGQRLGRLHRRFVQLSSWLTAANTALFLGLLSYLAWTLSDCMLHGSPRIDSTFAWVLALGLWWCAWGVPAVMCRAITRRSEELVAELKELVDRSR